MDINNYAENLMESILESYDSVVLEGFKKEKKDKEMRLAKTEFLNYLSTVHPDFDKKELEKAIYYYQNRERRFGGRLK